MQGEVTINTVQEAHLAIADAVMEKMKARGPGCPKGQDHLVLGTCNVDDWMQGLDEGASDGEVRRTGDSCTQCIIGHGRQRW